MKRNPKKNGADGRHKGRWCGWEVAQIETLYGARDDGALARMLERPIESVRAQARAIFGAKPSRQGKAWTAEEDQRLRACLGVSAVNVISLVLRRPALEIAERVEDLSRKVRSGHWTSEEVRTLKSLYGSRDDNVLSVILSRPAEEIRQRAAEHRLAKSNALLRRLAEEGRGLSSRFLGNGNPRMSEDGGSGRAEPRKGRLPRWTAEEVATLKAIYSHKFNVDIAMILRKSCKSIMSKAHDLGLRKSADLLVLMGKTNVGVRYARRGAEPLRPAAEASASASE